MSVRAYLPTARMLEHAHRVRPLSVSDGRAVAPPPPSEPSNPPGHQDSQPHVPPSDHA